MSNKKSVVISFVVFLTLLSIVFWGYQEKGVAKQREKRPINVITKESKAVILKNKPVALARDEFFDNQDGPTIARAKRLAVGEADRRYRVRGTEQIKQAAIKLVNDLYSDYDDMDFSRAYVAEMVFAVNTNPDYSSFGYYLLVLRNLAGEIMARVVLNVIEENGEIKLLEAGNVEPFPPAFTDMEIQNQYRNAERYPLTDSFPRISKEKVIESVQANLGSSYSFQGLTDLFISIPSLDFPYQIGVPFQPYYKFIVAGEEEKTIWVNSETGFVVDYDHLRNEIDLFEKDLENQRQNPPLIEPGHEDYGD